MEYTKPWKSGTFITLEAFKHFNLHLVVSNSALKMTPWSQL